jgi:glycerol-3-phosphate dehydrogenase
MTQTSQGPVAGTAPAGEPFDLLIVGGGINGVGIARDAAGRGLKVALVEQSDLASATSSASTKLIHGGLRYLELFEFRLVREALIEREKLLGIAPHIIRPMRFVLPHVEGLRPRWQIRLGLFFYDHIAGRRRLQGSRNVKIAGTELGDGVQPQIAHGFVYSDCWVDDARLVVLNAMDAAQRGAAIFTRTKLVSATMDGKLWRAQVEDRRTLQRRELVARAMVNAAGPWVQQVLRSVHEASAVRTNVRLVKGSHIIVPPLYTGSHAFLLQNPDGRVVFTIPYEGRFTLIGTTDVPFTGNAAEVSIDDSEIEYLCKTVSSYFTQRVTPADVLWTYAGVRPLTDDDSQNASKVTRDYKLELTDNKDEPPLLTIFGGKITTYRRLAEAALQKLQPFIKGNPQGWTDQAALPGGDLPRDDFAAFLDGVQRRWPFLPESMALRMARAYGTRISEVIGAARHLEDLGRSFGAGLTQAEIDYLKRHEWALTAEDILWRRTKLGLHMTRAEREALTKEIPAAVELPESQPG